MVFCVLGFWGVWRVAVGGGDGDAVGAAIGATRRGVVSRSLFCSQTHHHARDAEQGHPLFGAALLEPPRQVEERVFAPGLAVVRHRAPPRAPARSGHGRGSHAAGAAVPAISRAISGAVAGGRSALPGSAIRRGRGSSSHPHPHPRSSRRIPSLLRPAGAIWATSVPAGVIHHVGRARSGVEGEGRGRAKRERGTRRGTRG